MIASKRTSSLVKQAITNSQLKPSSITPFLGCIRMKNEDLIELKQYINPGTLVVIIPGKLDIQENTNPQITIKDINN